MFKVKYTGPGIFSIQLERGSFSFTGGKSFDLEGDGRCSRSWIDNDLVLNNLLGSGTLIVVFDSESDSIPNHDFTAEPRKRTLSKAQLIRAKDQVKEDKPVVIDLSGEPEVSDDADEVEKSLQKTEEVLEEASSFDDTEVPPEPVEDKEDTSEPAEDPIEEPFEPDDDSGLSSEDLMDMKKKELKSIASDLEISTSGKNKKQLVAAILKAGD